MTQSERWREAAERVLSAQGHARSAAFAEFYALAEVESQRVLQRFPPHLREMDLMHDLLAEHSEEVLRARSPRSYFCTALSNRVIDALRAQKVRNLDTPAAQDPSGGEPSVESLAAPGTEVTHDGRDFVIDARDALSSLTPREREVLAAVGYGEDRDELARLYGTSRENIDQIVSRARRKWRQR